MIVRLSGHASNRNTHRTTRGSAEQVCGEVHPVEGKWKRKLYPKP